MAHNLDYNRQERRGFDEDDNWLVSQGGGGEGFSDGTRGGEEDSWCVPCGKLGYSGEKSRERGCSNLASLL